MDQFAAYRGHPQQSYQTSGYGRGDDNRDRRQPEGYAPHPPPASRGTPGPNYRWWIPENGIRRDVIQADIQRYLGQDALVKPGEGINENQGQRGYWIAAYRNLTSTMQEDLRADSINFVNQGARGRYEDSVVHKSRQHWGATDESSRAPSAPSVRPESSISNVSGYTTNSSSSNATYSTAPSQFSDYRSTTGTYGSTTSGGYGNPPPVNGQPGYGLYPSSSGGQNNSSSGGPSYTYSASSGGHRGEAGQPAHIPRGYHQEPDSGSRNTAPTSYSHPRGSNTGPPSTAQAPPGYYLASDGRYYPSQ